MIAPFSVRRTALAGLIALLALPSAALAADAPTGGVAPTTTATPAAPSPGHADPAAPAAQTPTPTRATAELAGAGRWRAVPSAGTGSPLHVIGDFTKDLSGRRVRVERRTATGWSQATTARIRSSGRFVATWRTSSTRVHELRVVLVPTGDAAAAKPDPAAASARATADVPSVKVAVLGRVKATWYGPGLWGNTTSCDLTLQPDVVGVAHRTLPCGTQVEIRRGGRTVVVPVIDRGPFANGATFDLTKAAADRVGVDGVNPVTWVQRDDLPVVATPSAAARR